MSTPQSTPSSPDFTVTNMGVGSARFYQLARMPRQELERVMTQGSMPKLNALANWQFRGLNQPAWAKAAGIKKFKKGFFWEGEQLYGYNCPVKQTDITLPWIGKPNDEHSKHFGFYTVSPVDAAAKDNHYLNAVLLNYGKGGNKVYDPTRGLRDYVVQVDPDNEDLYLGKAYFALGPVRVATNFFILERHRHVTGTVIRP